MALDELLLNSLRDQVGECEYIAQMDAVQIEANEDVNTTSRKRSVMNSQVPMTPIIMEESRTSSGHVKKA